MRMCADSSPGVFPFAARDALEDVADLYIYRFCDRLDPEAFPRRCLALRSESGRSDLDAPAFMTQTSAALQALADQYFTQGWPHNGLVEGNKTRFEALLRRYADAPEGPETHGLAVGTATAASWDDAQSSKGLTLACFCSPDTPVCQRLRPVFGAAARHLHERRIARCVEVDAQGDPSLAQRLRVRALPCLKLFHRGREIGELIGTSTRTVTDILNFVLDQRRVEAEKLRGLASAGEGDGLDRARLREELRDVEEDRRAFLLHEKFRALQPRAHPEVHRQVRIRTPTGDEPPRIIFLGGGMAAGKSTVVRALADTPFWRRYGEQVVIIEADSFKTADPLFTSLVELGVADAATVVHPESVASAEELLLDAVQQGRDVVLDGTLAWQPFTAQTVEMVRNSHRYEYRRGPGYHHGPSGEVREQYWIRGPAQARPGVPYHVEMVGVTVRPEIAVQRGIIRHIVSDRRVPLAEQLQSHRLFATNFPRYLRLFDAALLLDNSGGSPTANVVAVQGDGVLLTGPPHPALEVRDPRAYGRFLAQRYLNPLAQGMQDLYRRPGPDPG
jgi:hypothetical protein